MSESIVFEKSNIKEIRLSQFTTNPEVVRGVITFEEGFDTSKVKLIYTNGNIIVKCANLPLKNDYFNSLYDENAPNLAYSSIVANSQVIQKVAIPQNTSSQVSNSTMAEIQQALKILH